MTKTLGEHLKSGAGYSALSNTFAVNVGLIIYGFYPEVNAIALTGIVGVVSFLTNMISIVVKKRLENK